MQFPTYFPVYTYTPPSSSSPSSPQTIVDTTQAKIQQMFPNGEILSFKLGMNDLPEGKASYWHPSGTIIYFSFLHGEIHGPATFRNRPEGYKIKFNYVKGVPHGPAVQKWSDGKCKHFAYDDGVAVCDIQRELSKSTLSNRHKKFEMPPSPNFSPTTPLHPSEESSKKEETDSSKISPQTVQTMLKNALEANLSIWDDLFIQKLPTILKKAIANKNTPPLDPNFVKMIGIFFISNNHLSSLDIKIQVGVIKNLLQLGYQTEQINLIHDSFIRAGISRE